MTFTRRMLLQGASAVGASAFVSTGALGSEYPLRTIRFVVPYPPGGGTDLVPRAFAEIMSQDLKQTIVIENRPGADGAIGTAVVSQAKPDGYTVLVGANGPLVTGPFIQADLKFDPAKALVPVAMLADSPFVLIVPNSSPYKKASELVAAAKAKPGEVSFGSTGIGSSGHLAGALLEKSAGITMKHVPYSGASQVLVDIIGGRIDCFFAAYPSASSAINDNKVRPIAMASLKRSPLKPDLATIAETDYPGFDTGTWISLMVPVGTPKPVIDKLYESAAKASKLPKINDFLARIGCEPNLMDPTQLDAFLLKERTRWHAAIKDFGLAIK